MFDDMKLSGIELEYDDGISKENKAVNDRTFKHFYHHFCDILNYDSPQTQCRLKKAMNCSSYFYPLQLTETDCHIN